VTVRGRHAGQRGKGTNWEDTTTKWRVRERRNERDRGIRTYLYTSRKFDALFNRIRLRHCNEFAGEGECLTL